MHLLPSTFIKPSIIVINIDKHYMPGSHWVAVCISDSGYAEYFNSYGLPPYKFEIMAFLQRHSISRTFNRHRPQKTQFISGLVDRIVNDITQLGCPPLADKILPGIRCTIACHNKSRNVCELRTAY